MAHIQNFEQKATIVGRETTWIVAFLLISTVTYSP